MTNTVLSSPPPGLDPVIRLPHRRLSGEKAALWLFAASFSIGAWGLALKLISPAIHHKATPAVQYVIVEPSGAGGSTIYINPAAWAPEPKALPTRPEGPIVPLERLESP